MTLPSSRVGAPLLVLLTLLCFPTGATAQRGASGPVPVLTATASAQPVPISLFAVGRVEPIESVEVRPQVSGIITRVGFEEGAEVRAGQLLFEIDRRPLAAALAAAEAQLARDRAEADNARVQAERYERLVARDFVTKEQAESARTQAAVLAAAVQAGEAAVEQARLNLAYASITAPIAGRTGSILVKKGNVARANDAPLVVINQMRPIRTSFAVAGEKLTLIRRYAAQSDLEVRVGPARDGSEPPLVGRLSFVDNAFDAGTGTVTLKAEFPNEDGRLWPGQFVDVELVLTVEPEALTVPAGAVVTGQQGSFVFVVGSDHKVEKRAVAVNRTVGGTAVLDSGLVAGETVVTDGQLRLVPGATVEIKAGLSEQGAAR